MIAQVKEKLLEIRQQGVLTQGSVGQKLAVQFSEEWEGLTVTAVFSAGSVTRDVAVTGEELVIPWEVFAEAGLKLYLNFHGAASDGSLVMRSSIASLGEILPSRSPSGNAPDAPSPSRADQIQALAEQALSVAQSVRSDADSGVFNGADGADGVSPTMDAALDPASENPVQNRVLSAALLAAFPVDTAGGALATFADGTDGLPVKDLRVHIKPKRSGSGAPAPNNLRPISGRTGAVIQQTGKNLFDLTIVTTTHSGNWGIAVDGDELTVTHKNTYWTGVPAVSYTLPAGTYTLYGGAQQATGIELKKNGSYVANVTASYTFTVDEGDTIELLFYLSAAGAIVFKQIQLEVGSTATSYEPYSGDTYAISWQTEAGTVYGGTLDVTTGLLTVTDAQIASYAGETLPGKWISDRDVYAEGTTPTAGAQVVYALATPVTYQLTAQEVRTLLGANNIWADTGDTTVQYRADPTRYIDKRLLSAKSLLAGVEAGFTATRNYAAGSLLIVEDRLYKTTAAIANGGAITPGTNTADTTVAEQLTLLANT